MSFRRNAFTNQEFAVPVVTETDGVVLVPDAVFVFPKTDAVFVPVIDIEPPKLRAEAEVVVTTLLAPVDGLAL